MNRITRYIACFLPALALFASCGSNKTETYIYPQVEITAWNYNNDDKYDEIRKYLKKYIVSGNDTILVWIYPLNKKKISMTREEILKKYGEDVEFLEVCE